MTIQIDTREHKEEYERIVKQFDKLGVKHYRSKLYVGDYQNLDNPRRVIDRKKDLLELCGNVAQQHERFRNELLRAMDAGISVTILCEHGEDIKCLEDVYFWKNPRKHKVTWKTVNGKKIKSVVSDKAMDGEQLYKALNTMSRKYDVQFEFCQKDETGRRIKELLE